VLDSELNDANVTSIGMTSAAHAPSASRILDCRC